MTAATKRCSGSYAMPYNTVVVSRSPDWKATGTCPVCGRRVKVSRPTQRNRVFSVGAHRVRA